jgi:hypothetical protein
LSSLPGLRRLLVSNLGGCLGGSDSLLCASVDCIGPFGILFYSVLGFLNGRLKRAHLLPHILSARASRQDHDSSQNDQT